MKPDSITGTSCVTTIAGTAVLLYVSATVTLMAASPGLAMLPVKDMDALAVRVAVTEYGTAAMGTAALGDRVRSTS